MADVEAKSISTLKAFYDLMHETAVVRRPMVQAVMEGGAIEAEHLERLRSARQSLAAIPRAGEKHRLSLDEGSSIEVDLDYEIGELDKDIVYAEQGEARLLEHLAGLHEGFERQVSEVEELLSNVKFNTFITDRDGTINNYCGRYGSSIQSAYNAVFVSRFAKSRARHPIIMTSAPLKDVGLLDVNVSPPGIFIHAASKGREFVDMQDRRHSFPIEDEKKALIDSLEVKLRELISHPQHQKFGLIGSGFQVKFGQITIARQDISKSIDPEESGALLEKVRARVEEVDPDEKHFRIEDTGLDIEIILTISGDGDELKDFDKGDGVHYVSRALGLGMSSGPHLVCGDTSSDLPMLRAAMDCSPEDTFSVFVTRKDDLAGRVREICPRSVVVEEPDVLVAALNRLAPPG
ncbi:MAG: trehalose 6-phosphate synthase [Myxococcota bacterium]